MAIMLFMADMPIMAIINMAGIHLTAITNKRQQQEAEQAYSLLAMTPT